MFGAAELFSTDSGLAANFASGQAHCHPAFNVLASVMPSTLARLYAVELGGFKGYDALCFSVLVSERL